MNIKKWSHGLLVLACFCANPLFALDEDGHEQIEKPIKADDREELGHEEEDRVHLNDEQRRSAGIVVEVLTFRPVPTEIEAPGEIRFNAYASSQVTSRIEAQVVQRHARLGEHVVVGQPLVTLTSVSMAEAQGELMVVGKEWQRVKKLGGKVVSERRYLETQVAFQQARAKLLAYGMTAKQIERLIGDKNTGQADGRFVLLSPQNGTVIRDDFIVGQMVEPGERLFDITDESKLWVEARINPEFVSQLDIGAPARVLAGETWIDGKVIQVYHSLDETTRTLAVRLEVPNPGDRLHPGQFVTARIQTGRPGEAALTLPLDAVLLTPDGGRVFVEEEPGQFVSKEVEVVRQLPGLVIIDGLEPGIGVVTQGAFFVQSELAKSSFEIHSH